MNKLICTIIIAIFFLPVLAQDTSHVIIQEFASGNKLAKKNGKWGLLSPSNEIIYPFELYDSYKNYNNGLLRIKQEYADSAWYEVEKRFLPHRKMRYGLLNARTGAIILPPVYNYIDDFENGRTIITSDTLSGIINDSGRIILPIAYRKLKQLNNGNYVGSNKVAVVFLDRSLKQIAEFRDVVRFEPSSWPCVFIYRQKEKESLVDCDGKQFGGPNWKEVLLERRELAFVRTTDKQLVVYDMKNRKAIISGDYNSFFHAERGAAIVMCRDTTWTVFDLTGKKGGQFTGTTLQHNNDLGFFVKHKDLWGYADKTGKMIVTPQWKYLEPYGSYGRFRMSNDAQTWNSYNSDGTPRP